MHVQSDRGRVAMRSMAAARVRSRAHKPGPSGSAEKRERKRNSIEESRKFGIPGTDKIENGH